MSDMIQNLSDDAKAVASAFFPTMDSRVTFHMTEHGPSPRSQAALDELVASGGASKELHDARTGAATYRPLVDFSELSIWNFKRLMRGEGADLVLWQRLTNTPK